MATSVLPTRPIVQETKPERITMFGGKAAHLARPVEDESHD